MLGARELPAKRSQPGGGAVGRAARVAPGREKRIAAVCWRAAAEPVGAERTASEPKAPLPDSGTPAAAAAAAGVEVDHIGVPARGSSRDLLGATDPVNTARPMQLASWPAVHEREKWERDSAARRPLYAREVPRTPMSDVMMQRDSNAFSHLTLPPPACQLNDVRVHLRYAAAAATY